jgi:hypothetical protein
MIRRGSRSRSSARPRSNDLEQAETTRWLDATELDSWIPFSGMLLTLLSSLDAQLQRDSKVSLFGYLVMAGLSESPDRSEISRRILVGMTGGPIPGLRNRTTS